MSMAPPPACKSAQKRPRDAGDGLDRRSGRPPTITYGKRVKPLPLRGTHFRRRDPYEIPPDSDSEEESQPVIKPKGSRRPQVDPDDSPLSEDELEAVYGRDASPVRSASDSPGISTSSSKTSVDKKVSAPSTKLPGRRSGAKATHKAPTKPAALQHKPRTSMPPKHLTETSSKQPRKKLPVPPRRLPVNELVLVASQAPEEATSEPVSSHRESHPSDPIDDSSNPRSGGAELPIEDESHYGRKAPITSIRKRLKTPKFTHKSVVALRNRQCNAKRGEGSIGDGFELSELHIDHRLKIRRNHKVTKPLVLGFSALNLQAGPLPDVKFEDCSSELKVERSGEDHEVNADYSDAFQSVEQEFRPASPREVPKSRKVGFSDRVLDEMVMKQLSSISAPRRVYSISSDHSDDDEEDFEETDDEDEEEDEDEAQQEEEEHTPNVPPLRRAPTPPSNQRARQNSSHWRRQPSPVTPAPVNHGVTLDFRKPHGLAQAPTPFGKRKLMEVDDMIYDEPERPPPQVTSNDLDEEMLDEPQEDFSPAPPPPTSPPPRPRSILRDRKSMYQHSDTRPEDTAANTRRNSRRDSVMLDDDESRYFTAATDMLQQNMPKPRIQKDRSSELRRRRSSYFDQRGEVQVPDSDARVLETSPERPDYTKFTNLDVLKRSSEAVWTSSQSLPKVPRDLKSLTRSVSRDYGTTGIRRRPSLPFQSPTKAQRR